MNEIAIRLEKTATRINEISNTGDKEITKVDRKRREVKEKERENKKGMRPQPGYKRWPQIRAREREMRYDQDVTNWKKEKKNEAKKNKK